MSVWLSLLINALTGANENDAAKPAPSLDDYDLTSSRTLGTGADAKVISALQVATGKRVALKIIEKAKRRPDQLDRSRNEGRLISSVFDHPNVIKGYPHIESDNLLILPMEYATMGDLLDLVNNRHGFPEPEARNIFSQLAEGLAHAHSKCILHGDIKLENVVVFPPSKEDAKRGNFNRRFAICDWGYARLNTGETLKKAFGSLLYSAPEVITGTGFYGTPSDIWGLGVILYALIYATLPFGGKDLRHNIANANFAFPPEVPVSPYCKDLISGILRVEPSKRLSMAEIRAHPWLAGGMPKTKTPSQPLSPVMSSVSDSPLLTPLHAHVISGDANTLNPGTESVSKEPPPTSTGPANRPSDPGCWLLDDENGITLS